MRYFSIDCEAVKNNHINFGPASIKESHDCIANFTNILSEFAIQGELFITPSCAKDLHTFLAPLAQFHLLSLHLHLPSFKSKYYGQKIELANLSFQKQYEILYEAVNIFSDFFGKLPMGFRPGMASANLDTIEILQKLGINRGSITVPGLVNNKYNINWANSPTTPHYIGSFYNLPLTHNLCIDPRYDWSLPQESYLAIYTHNWLTFSKESFEYQKLKSCLK